MHGGSTPQSRRRATVHKELQTWGLGDPEVDPGVVLLRLVSQSAARVERYSLLLQEAYDAAETLRELQGTHDQPMPPDGASPAAQRARAEFEAVFTGGGVAALVGKVYAAAKSGDVYETTDAIRALVRLEAEERDRCAQFAKSAIQAGLAERQVRLAERQGAMLADLMRAVLGDPGLGLSDDQRAAAPRVIRHHLDAMIVDGSVVEPALRALPAGKARTKRA